MPPAQRICRGARRCVGQHGQDEALGVPEGVAVVSRPGQALRGNRALLGPGARLEDVVEREADGLLELGVAVQLDVRAGPEVVQVGALALDEAVPARVLGHGDRGGDLVADRGQRTLARPAVGEELHDSQALARREVGGDAQASDVGEALSLEDRGVRALDHVVHRCGHAQLALLGRVDEDDSGVVVAVPLRLERGLEHGGDPRILRARGHRLVRDQLRLDGDPQLRVRGLHLVEDRGHRTVHEGDEPRRGHADRRSCR